MRASQGATEHESESGQTCPARGDLDPVDRRDRNVLLYAARGGSAAVVQELLAKGMSAASSDGEGRTALHVAAKDGQIDVVRLLLAAKADLNAREQRASLTPLMVAAEGGHLEVVKELVGAKADLAAKNK